MLAAHDYRKQNAESSDQEKIPYGSILASLAALYQWTDSAKAVTYAQQASDVFESQLGDSAELADSLNLLGISLQREDKLDEAIVAHERSLSVRENLWPEGHEKHDNVAISLHTYNSNWCQHLSQMTSS